MYCTKFHNNCSDILVLEKEPSFFFVCLFCILPQRPSSSWSTGHNRLTKLFCPSHLETTCETCLLTTKGLYMRYVDKKCERWPTNSKFDLSIQRPKVCLEYSIERSWVLSLFHLLFSANAFKGLSHICVQVILVNEPEPSEQSFVHPSFGMLRTVVFRRRLKMQTRDDIHWRIETAHVFGIT